MKFNAIFILNSEIKLRKNEHLVTAGDFGYAKKLECLKGLDSEMWMYISWGWDNEKDERQKDFIR